MEDNNDINLQQSTDTQDANLQQSTEDDNDNLLNDNIQNDNIQNDKLLAKEFRRTYSEAPIKRRTKKAN